jgi:hypothetical protein
LLVVIWYIFSRFGILYQEKSGNPAWDRCYDFKNIFDKKCRQITAMWAEES